MLTPTTINASLDFARDALSLSKGRTRRNPQNPQINRCGLLPLMC